MKGIILIIAALSFLMLMTTDVDLESKLIEIGKSAKNIVHEIKNHEPEEQ